jgi:ABC-2 type transport system ATP-binding protein
VQRVADRVAIIRHGRLVAVEALDDLRAKAMRRIDLEFTSPVDASVLGAIDGVSDVSVRNHRAELAFSGKMAVLLRALADRYDVVDVNTREADLEEIFLTFYRDDADDGARPQPQVSV